jgi:hypothetical protein
MKTIIAILVSSLIEFIEAEKRFFSTQPFLAYKTQESIDAMFENMKRDYNDQHVIYADGVVVSEEAERVIIWSQDGWVLYFEES